MSFYKKEEKEKSNVTMLTIFIAAFLVGLVSGSTSSVPNPDPELDLLMSQMKVLFYYNGSIENCQTIPLFEFVNTMQNSSAFNKTAKTVFYYGDLGINPRTDPDTKDLIKAFLSVNVNLFVVDFSIGFPASLPDSRTVYDYTIVYRIYYIGSQIGLASQIFNNSVQNVGYVHNVGHGIGVQLLSQIAQSFGDGEIQSFIGLDPTGWDRSYEFYTEINPFCAKLVAMFHTDYFGAGYNYPLGKVDVFVNSYNESQSYCNQDSICNHKLAVKYLTNSIRHPGVYQAKKCNTKERCALNPDAATVEMGFFIDQNASPGSYYLQTPTATSDPLALVTYDYQYK